MDELGIDDDVPNERPRRSDESLEEEEEEHLEHHRGSHVVKDAATIVGALDPTQPHPFHQPKTSSSLARPVQGRPSGAKDEHSTSPSVTLRIFDQSRKDWQTSLSLILSSLTINLLLPFVNGVMLGFGEIIAHEILAVYGWTGARSVISRLRTSIRQGGSEERESVGRMGATGGLGTAAIGMRADAGAKRRIDRPWRDV